MSDNSPLRSTPACGPHRWTALPSLLGSTGVPVVRGSRVTAVRRYAAAALAAITTDPSLLVDTSSVQAEDLADYLAVDRIVIRSKRGAVHPVAEGA